ncbi:Uncharacterized protein ChrSV_0072 [Chromobacterium vaccinii]|nr:Uncharacterized protein ChrSW_0072 [Chromobacterium vaccinii]QND87531.1 Uncharacterized protein ChrSV_0072 [Chromobacterium vaccinii]
MPFLGLAGSRHRVVHGFSASVIFLQIGPVQKNQCVNICCFSV